MHWDGSTERDACGFPSSTQFNALSLARDTSLVGSLATFPRYPSVPCPVRRGQLGKETHSAPEEACCLYQSSSVFVEKRGKDDWTATENQQYGREETRQTENATQKLQIIQGKELRKTFFKLVPLEKCGAYKVKDMKTTGKQK